MYVMRSSQPNWQMTFGTSEFIVKYRTISVSQKPKVELPTPKTCRLEMRLRSSPDIQTSSNGFQRQCPSFRSAVRPHRDHPPLQNSPSLGRRSQPAQAAGQHRRADGLHWHTDGSIVQRSHNTQRASTSVLAGHVGHRRSRCRHTEIQKELGKL